MNVRGILYLKLSGNFDMGTWKKTYQIVVYVPTPSAAVSAPPEAGVILNAFVVGVLERAKRENTHTHIQNQLDYCIFSSAPCDTHH